MMRSRRFQLRTTTAGALLASALCVTAPCAHAQDAATPQATASTALELSLADAVRSALSRHPLLQEARGNARAAAARVDEALAPLLPQLATNASYQRATTPRSGVPFASGPTSYGLWTFAITANQLVYDFGVTSGNYRAVRENGEVARR